MTQTRVAIEVPPGFRQNGKGHLVPEYMISDMEKLIDDQVCEIAAKWKVLSQALADFKTGTFGDIHALIGTVNEQYKVKKGGEKGNVQLLSYDADYKVLVAVNEIIALGPEIQPCVEKMRECTAVWKEGARTELKVIVDEFLATDGKGSFSISKLLQIRRLLQGVEDEDWRMAMKALDDALRVIGSKQYLRLYERNAAGAYIAIPLDIAAL
jgi:hypothetical protein